MFIRRTSVITIGVAVALAQVAATASASPGKARSLPRSTITLRLVNEGSGRCLDSNSEGAVYTLPCNGTDYQGWRLEFLGDATYRMMNLRTGRILNSDTAGNLNGATAANTDGSQDWSVRDEVYTNRATRFALDSNAEGRVYSLPVNGSPWQRWAPS